MAGRPNMRLATTAPRTPPATWAAISAAASRVLMPPRTRSRTVTTGLNAADTGCRARIKATRAAPVTTLFSNSCRPTSSGDKRWAAIPEPITAATKNAVPTNSAVA